MIKVMTQIAAACFHHLTRQSDWVPELGKYVLPDSKETQTYKFGNLINLQISSGTYSKQSLDPRFKLVFVTATVGTILFALACVLLTFLVGKEPPPLFEKVIMGLFDLAKIGFGAVVGLLGSKGLELKEKKFD